MVFRKVLEMSKTKIMRPSAYPIATITRRERIPATGAYDTVKSTTSSMDDLSAHVLGFKWYWLSTSIIFTLKYILGTSIICLVVVSNAKIVNWMLWIFTFSHSLKNESYQSDLRGLLFTSLIWSGVGGFVGRLIFSPTYWMCMIWLNMHLSSWILVLKMFLSLRGVMTWTLLYFPVSCWF